MRAETLSAAISLAEKAWQSAQNLKQQRDVNKQTAIQRAESAKAETEKAAEGLMPESILFFGAAVSVITSLMVVTFLFSNLWCYFSTAREVPQGGILPQWKAIVST